MKKLFAFALFFSTFFFSAKAQYQVTDSSGVESFGIEKVNIVPIGAAYYYSTITSIFCGVFPYGLIVDHGNSITSAYKFEFSLPVTKVKMYFSVVETSERMDFFINGNLYSINSSQVYPYNRCSNNTTCVASAGELAGPPNAINNNGSAEVDINPGYPIDSIRILHNLIPATSGCVMSFFFDFDTALIIKPVRDTVLCKGDTIHVDYDVKANADPSNQFILQLSNAAGSFANPVNIATLNSDTGGTLKGVIPGSIANGTGYRVRIISTNPQDTSVVNDRNISIGILNYPFSAGSNSPVCAGGTLKLNTNAIPGAGYVWNGPGFSSNQQNPQLSPALTGNSGNYTVTASVPGCTPLTSSTTVTVANGPTVAMYPNPNDTICDGQGVAFSSIVTNGGTNPTYQWYKNGNTINGANNKTYSATGVKDKDTFYVTLRAAGGTCNGDVQSNKIVMTVEPNATNLATSITVDPSGPVWAGLQLKFTASTTGCNGDVTYQWYANGVPVQNATTNPWLTTRLSDKVNISCKATCHGCAIPDTAMSNSIQLDVSTNVEEAAGRGSEQIRVYPNPNEGRFRIIAQTHPYTPLERGSLEVFNAIGQRVYSKEVKAVNGKIDEAIDLGNVASGVYMVRIESGSCETIMLKVNKN